MKCKKCNNALKQEDRYCAECGNHSIENTVKVRPFSKKAMIFLSSCIVLILLSVILYQIGLSATSAKKTVAAFKEAVQENDTNTITSLLDSSLDNWEFNKKDASLLLQYFKDYPDDKDKLFAKLDQKALDFEEKNKRTKFEEKQYATISLQQRGKKWLLFPNYILRITPANIRVAVDKADAKIFIGETEVEANTKKNDYQSYGPFSIGTYEVKAVLPGKYIDAEETTEIVLFDLEDSQIDEALSINASKVEAFTAYEGVTLYMNGKKTDAIIGTSPEELGMVPIDGSVVFTLEKEFPWGTATSEDFPVEKRRMDLSNFAVLSSDMRQDIMNMLNENWEQHTEALQTADTSKMSLAPDKYKEAVQKQAESLQERSKEYIATFIQARYDVDTLKTPIYNEETNRYELKVEAEYTLNEPELHTYSLLRKGDDATTTYYMTLYFDENEEEWKIENYSVGSFFLSSLHEIKTYEIAS